MAQLSTQNPGETPESIAQREALEAASASAAEAVFVAEEAAIQAAVDGGATIQEAQFAHFSDPAYRQAVTTADQTAENVRYYEPVYGETTYYDGATQIDVDEYDVTRLEQATAGSDDPEVNIVGNVEVGRVTADDPVAARQMTAEELEGEDTIAANIRLAEAKERALIPGTPEYEAAEGQKIIDANIAAGEAEEAKIAGDLAYNKALKEASDAKTAANEENDWRVRLHLAPEADYLYAADDPGILAPLAATNGIIFPYTPEMAVQYSADYENYDLVHSNYRGYFYTGSKVENIIITATFTANNVEEANYMLATMHFLRTATKMFYGQDQKRGMPPPIMFLSGLGEYQFNNHPCALTMFQYNLPTDVDYIPCGKPSGIAPPPTPKRENYSTPEARLRGGECTIGGEYPHDGPVDAATGERTRIPYTKATYVPTQISLNFTMIPIQTRDQISKEFSLKDYATGDLLRKGFW